MAERNPSDDQAAFGVFPQLKRNRAKQDREAAKNVPVDLARGALAGVLGAPGDIESLIRMLPYIDEKTILPTSEDIEKKIPFKSDTPVSRAATGLGQLGGGFYYGPGSPLKVVGALPKAIKHGAEEFAKASVAGVPHVIKPKGGNWLGGGDKLTIPENDLRRLKQNVPAEVAPNIDPRFGIDPAEQSVQRQRALALNKWIDSNLTNYVKKEMATPDDPVRKLAEEGIIHTPLRQDPDRMEYLQALRKAEGFPAEGMGQSPLAKQWENLTDDSIRVSKAGKIQDAANVSERVAQARAEIDAYKLELDKNFLARMSDLAGNQIFSQKEAEMLLNMPEIQKAEILGDTRYKELKDNLYLLMAKEQGFEKRAGELNPFVANLDPETRLYSGSTYDLGFDHIIDVLKEDVAAGRIRPEQLNKVSMEQAVRRTFEYDQEMAKKMAEAAIKQTEGFPTYKEYPEGYRWLELAKPKITADTPLPEGFRWLEPKGGYERLEGPSILDPQRTRTYLGETKDDALKVAEDRSTLGSEQLKMLEDALKYEGDTMGHCVGGYCPDVVEGKSRIFSLRDAKGEPHVTVEVQPSRYAPRHEDVKQYMTAAEEEAKALPQGYTDRDISDIAVRMAKENAPQNIIQIKGKGNAAPKADYLPFVQDFVKSGKWGDVGDIKNTGLYKLDKDFLGQVSAYMPQAEDIKHLKQPQREEAILKAMEANELKSGYITREEYENAVRKYGSPTYGEVTDDLLRQLDAPIPPAEGMKAGGKVSISSNPDAMMLELNNQKMAKGGKAVKFVEDVAPAAMEKLAMMFGNKLPLNMNAAEVENLAKRYPSVDRINMNYKDVTKRVPELTEAAQKLQAGELDRETYAQLVKALKPVKPYDFIPKPATAEEARGALREDARDLYGVPSKTLQAGAPVGLRLDIPAYRDSGVWVPTIHEQDAGFGAGKKIGHESVASVLNPEFGMSEKAALSIATGKPKGTIATIKGDWNPTSEAEVVSKAQQYLKNPEWRQVGMDPERHSFFYDRETMAPVINAEEVIQIGPLVLAKNPKYGKPENFKYAGGGLTGLVKGAKAAFKAEPEIMKASEALGKIEGRPLVITQADRTKVGEGYLGGPGFSSLQLTEPEYRAAEAAWGVKTPGVAKMILGGAKKAGDKPVFTTMIGSPTQHQSNQMVFDKLYGDFKKAAKKGGLPTELRDKINDRLVRAVDKEGNPVFPADIDILDKKFRDIANTFDRRSIAGHLMGGVQVGGKKGQIIDYDKIIRETTDPALIDVPSGSLGNRLFTLSGGIIDRPDLHPAFPTILQGEDFGLQFSPVAKDILMRDFIEKTMREKGRKPGYMDFTRGHPPSQLITEDILTEMQKLGLKEGGEVTKPASGIKQPAAYINGDEFVNAAKKYGIKDSMNNLNKIVDLVNKGLTVDDAARQVADTGMHKAAGGAITGDDLIIEERPL